MYTCHSRDGRAGLPAASSFFRRILLCIRDSHPVKTKLVTESIARCKSPLCEGRVGLSWARDHPSQQQSYSYANRLPLHSVKSRFQGWFRQPSGKPSISKISEVNIYRCGDSFNVLPQSTRREWMHITSDGVNFDFLLRVWEDNP